MLKEKGILLIATGYPLYGNLAFNLAITVRAIDKETPIALACDEKAISHLNEKQRAIFDEIIPISLTGFGSKLHLDLITPFEKTLFLDADMAWMPKHSPQVLFDVLAEYDYTGITEGRIDLSNNDKSEVNGAYYFWADTDEIAEKYGLKSVMYQWRSEMIYFTKSSRVKKMFAKARKIHANPRLKTINLFGTQIPDELPLNISLALHDIHPHQFKWTPAYWPKLHGERVPPFEEMYDQYYLLSAGSHYATGALESVYNRLVNAAAYKMGGVRTFPLKHKAREIPDRANF